MAISSINLPKNLKTISEICVSGKFIVAVGFIISCFTSRPKIFVSVKSVIESDQTIRPIKATMSVITLTKLKGLLGNSLTVIDMLKIIHVINIITSVKKR
ncbi:hypothetical protein, partial [Neisseria dumasiana]